jgi:RHS repeat-associated protein
MYILEVNPQKIAFGNQLNRLNEAKSFNNIDLGANSWNTGGTTMYYNKFTFDANGNIMTQLRYDENSGSAGLIDNLTYNYKDVDGFIGTSNPKAHNRLYSVSDTKNYDATDIQIGQATNNYKYDAEGRLTGDAQEKILAITWRVDGKVKKITRNTGFGKKNVSFDYDAMGHRIAKHVYTDADVLEKPTYYVLDAQGNTMSVYERAVNTGGTSVSYAQTEKHIYGSSRLGLHTERIELLGTQNDTYSMTAIQHRIGDKNYELSNHLGNVLSVISDKIVPEEVAGGGTVIGFDDQFTTSGISLGWHYDASSIGTPASPGYSITFTGGEMQVITGAPFEHALKYFDIPDGSNYTISFDITYLDPVGDLYFLSQGASFETVSSTGSYSFNGTGENGTEMIGFLMAGGVTIHIDNVKLTYTAPATNNFLADIRHSQDYSPFGVTLHGRDLSLTSSSGTPVPYRYGYQGSERDDEVKGSGNSYTTEFRQLDPRLGRWLTIDPKATSMPWQSPYCSMDNNPIWFNDQLGDSVGIDETFQKDHAKMKAMEEMVKSKEGRDFLAKYAKKGQTIAGYTFKKDGEYHKKGLDLIFKRDNLENPKDPQKKKSGGGSTHFEAKQESADGIMKNVGGTITVTMHSGKGWQTDNYTYNSIITLFHETFIHVALGTEDYLDDNSFNNSNISNADKERAGNQEIHFQHKHTINQFEKNPSGQGYWPREAFNAFKRIAKDWNLGYSDEYIQKAMWYFSGGYSAD